jgi:CubicO group peptidase (beta-lactamase class C family)
MPEAEVFGEYEERFGPVCALLRDNLRSGVDLGASLVVDIDGETALDIWGGFCDSERTRPWHRDTIVNGWSTTKTVTNLAALMLAEHGEIDFDAPVARYWPEFAANGKRGVLVRHVLSHTSGLAGWDDPFSIEDLYDWEKSTALLAAQEPWWQPGAVSGYHGITQGHLVGEIVRRVTGIPLREFVAEQIAGPLRADFQIGAAEEDWARIAPVVPPPPVELDLLPEGEVALRSFIGPMVPASAANTADWRRATIGAANGHGNARSIARIMSVITLGGEIRGVHLLSPRTIDQIFEVQSDCVDLVLNLPLRFGLGYGLPQPETMPHVPEGRVCFWGGWGGSLVLMDLDRRMTVAFMMNRMAPGVLSSEASIDYTKSIYACLGVAVPG